MSERSLRISVPKLKILLRTKSLNPRKRSLSQSKFTTIHILMRPQSSHLILSEEVPTSTKAITISTNSIMMSQYRNMSQHLKMNQYSSQTRTFKTSWT